MFDVDQWLDSLKDKLDAEAIAAARKELKEGFMRKDEFSRKLDTTRDDYLKKEQALAEHQAKLNQWWQVNEARVRQMAEIEQEYGSLNDFRKVAGGYVSPSGDEFSNAEVAELKNELAKIREAFDAQSQNVQKAFNQLQMQSTNAIKFAVNRAQQYKELFKENFDLDHFDQFVTEESQKGRQFRDLDDAYGAYVAPKMAEREKQERAEWERRKTEEIRRDLQSREFVPSEVPGAESSPMLLALQRKREDAQRTATGKSDAELADRFARAFYVAKQD